MTDNKNFDVIIIGGSYAGLSSAMALGRSLRNVLIIDSGLPCNRQTPHSISEIGLYTTWFDEFETDIEFTEFKIKCFEKSFNSPF